MSQTPSVKNKKIPWIGYIQGEACQEDITLPTQFLKMFSVIRQLTFFVIDWTNINVGYSVTVVF